MKSRNSIILTIIILVAAIAGIAYVLTRNSKTTMETINNDTQTPVENGAWPSEEMRKETVDEKGKGYTISAVYPVTQSAAVTSYFRTFVDGAVTQFKQDTAWAADIENAESESLMLDVDYTRTKATSADNYAFQIATYTGGAHGLQVTKTFAFSPEGQPLTLSSLFTNGIDGLKSISPFVQKELMTRDFADKDWIADGAAPSETNYQNFIIEDSGVTFIFDPYQVAPYAAGIQKVTVPVSVFKSIANKDIF